MIRIARRSRRSPNPGSSGPGMGCIKQRLMASHVSRQSSQEASGSSVPGNGRSCQRNLDALALVGEFTLELLNGAAYPAGSFIQAGHEGGTLDSS